MSESPLDQSYQMMIAEGFCLAAESARQNAEHCINEIQEAMTRPSVLFKPVLSIDGTLWCALYGLNLQEGCGGFGDTPDKAMRDFDHQWLSVRLPPVRAKETREARQLEIKKARECEYAANSPTGLCDLEGCKHDGTD